MQGIIEAIADFEFRPATSSAESIGDLTLEKVYRIMLYLR
jgi:hypothetical protein